ncbi:DUF983 domain-containing protein [Sphingomonas oleivorans]|uniref:DUF983 domain-containing protein n=1 Tax=Sphingomonas oleivorans TaxID=1735121 RepID=UPI0013FDFF27|nr:DUF983 domain-containing protein [Sphingomonas oleivorans]
MPQTVIEGLKRGLARRCPACGRAPLFAGYLKIWPVCAVCGEENGRHRVDDAASYFTVLLAGHVVVAPALAIETFWTMPLWLATFLLLAMVVAATLLALPFVKGGVLGVLSALSARRGEKEDGGGTP